MQAILTLLVAVAGMDSNAYRDRINAQSRLDAITSPIAKPLLWRVARGHWSEEVRYRALRSCERRYGLTLSHITDGELAEIEEIVAALAKPKAWRKVAEIENRHEGHYVRWVVVVWPMLSRRLREVYTHEWVAELDWDRYQADPWVTDGMLSGIVMDLARQTTGEEDW